MVAVDLRGYGSSDAPRDVDCYTIDLLTADIQDIILGLGADTPVPGLASLTPASPRLASAWHLTDAGSSHPPGYSKCILVAHDWGALLAWNFSIYHPSLVTRMVVVGAAPMSVYQGVLGSPGRWDMPVPRGLSLCLRFLVHRSTLPGRGTRTMLPICNR